MGTTTELTQKHVRRLDVELEIAQDDLPQALSVCQNLEDIVLGQPRHENGRLVVTVDRYESIPDFLASLVDNKVRVFRLAARDANLEQVYFSIHEKGEK